MPGRSRWLAGVSRRRTGWLLVIAVLAAFAAGLLAGVFRLGSGSVSRESREGAPAASPTARFTGGSEITPSELEFPQSAPYEAGGGARVALVIDDLGRSLEEVSRVEELGVPLSYAVLPFEARTSEVVAALRQRGEEILCHLPMQPDGGLDPGAGALMLDMTEPELAAATRLALAETPGVVGVNNHMGSALSADRAAMTTIMGVLEESGLFYVDSRTSPDTVGYATALSLGIPAAERQVFLDPEPASERIREQFAAALDLARLEGAAIAIGHPSPTTLAVLRREVPLAREAGFEFVPVSYLLDRPLAAPE